MLYAPTLSTPYEERPARGWDRVVGLTTDIRVIADLAAGGRRIIDVVPSPLFKPFQERARD